jgi:hypothetical protein
MKMTHKRYSWHQQGEKLEYIDMLASDLLIRLRAAGATFYGYLGHDIMYVNGEVIDIFNQRELYQTIDQLWGPQDRPYAADVAASLRRQAKAFYTRIPEGTVGTVNQIKEPKRKMKRYLTKPIRLWVHEVLKSNILP